MKEYLKCYQLKIDVLSPIYIGSGQKLGKRDYMYLAKEHRAIIPDQDKLFQMILTKNLFRAYESFMLQDSRKCPSLEVWLKQQGIQERDFDKWKRYDVDAGDTSVGNKAKDAKEREVITREIALFMKDAYGEPFVPGSSIKGMIRTALLAWEIINHPEKYETVKWEIDQARPENSKADKKYLRQQAEKIEETAFHTFKREKVKLDNKVNSKMQALHVSDSAPIALEQLTLCQKMDYTLQGNVRELPIVRECLKPGTKILFEMTIDTSVPDYYTIKDIMDALNCFQELCYEYCYEEYGRGRNEDGLIWLGGGCGFMSKTVLHALHKEERYRVINKVFANTLSEKIYEEHNHKECSISPHMCKCTKYKGELYDMGMGRIELIKELSSISSFRM